MAIKLSLKKSIIPVEIGDFKFEVDLSDGKTKGFEEKMLNFLKGIKEYSQASDSKKELEILLKDIFDELLGIGAYEMLYNYAQRTDILAELLNELVLELVNKLPGRTELVNEIRAKKQMTESM